MGADTLTVLSTDSNGATDTDTVSITVSNAAPTNIHPASQTVAEDTSLDTLQRIAPDGEVRWIHDRSFPLADA
mgnify:CR=1 FL=1